MTKAANAEARRKEWHQGQIDAADTPKNRLWRVCGWLVAEAWRRNRITDVEAAVMAKIHELRGEEASDAHHGH